MDRTSLLEETMTDRTDRYYDTLSRLLSSYDGEMKENANFIRSITTVEHILLGKLIRDWYFDVLYSDLQLKELFDEGIIYLHQAFKVSPYCVGLSSRDLAHMGLASNAKNERRAKPPKRLDSLFLQAANLICLISQEVSGATSLNDISTVAASYLFEMERNGYKVSEYELQNLWQSFLYNINLPFRSGNSPFSNITLEFARPDSKLKDAQVFYAGKPMDYTYSDIPTEYFDRINLAFIRAMSKGDGYGNPFTFPLVTVNIDETFDFSNTAWREFLKCCDDWGGFYIQNYVRKPFEEDTVWKRSNPYLKAFDLGMIYSNCCRLTFDIKLVEIVTGSNPFHSGSGIGGIGVFSINLNRLLWIYRKDIQELKYTIGMLLDLGRTVLQRKRRLVRECWTLFPYLSYYIKSDRSLYSVFSLVGGHEGLQSAGFKGGVFNEEGRAYAHEILQYIVQKIEEYVQDNVLYSLEYAPSETAAVKMAKKDVEWGKKYSQIEARKKIEKMLEQNIEEV